MAGDGEQDFVVSFGGSTTLPAMVSTISTRNGVALRRVWPMSGSSNVCQHISFVQRVISIAMRNIDYLWDPCSHSAMGGASYNSHWWRLHTPNTTHPEEEEEKRIIYLLLIHLSTFTATNFLWPKLCNMRCIVQPSMILMAWAKNNTPIRQHYMQSMAAADGNNLTGIRNGWSI